MRQKTLDAIRESYRRNPKSFRTVAQMLDEDRKADKLRAAMAWAAYVVLLAGFIACLDWILAAAQ